MILGEMTQSSNSSGHPIRASSFFSAVHIVEYDFQIKGFGEALEDDARWTLFHVVYLLTNMSDNAI